MTDDGPWNLAAGRAREKQRRVVCGPAGTDHHIQPRRCFIRFGEGSPSLVKP